jgi:adenylylsulfate kinase
MNASPFDSREKNLRHGCPGLVIWFTGLSGAGKTTLAAALERRLSGQGTPTYLLDGDVLRLGLCRDLGFSLEDRKENIRRAGSVAQILADTGLVVLVALISPFRLDRDRIRSSLPPGKFVEVFVDTPLQICEQRDVKGLYKKARTGLISEFTGISSPYEPPLVPEVELRTDSQNVEQCVNQLSAYLDDKIGSFAAISSSAACPPIRPAPDTNPSLASNAAITSSAVTVL